MILLILITGITWSFYASSCVIYKCDEIGPTTMKKMKIQSNVAYTKYWVHTMCGWGLSILVSVI